MAHVDKVIVSNVSALKAKYGSGYSAIKKAVDALMAADAKRNIRSRFVALDSRTTMKGLKAPPVTKPGDPKQNKAAIDAVFRSLTPDYILILGSVDVIPHQDLVNPVYSPGNDDDRLAPGDLPYACEMPYSPKPQDFRGPTRVVGRVPDLTGGNDPAYLVRLLQVAAGHVPATRNDYASFLGVTAYVWKESTALSLKSIFGSSDDLKDAPPQGPNWSANLLGRRSHFFNCHGAAADPFFYGQRGNNYPQAHAAALLVGKVTPSTVVAAECCYGAELYDPSITQGQAGICNTYLYEKAFGFFGSSTIAYGPSAGNSSADLICQYFLQSVLNGASLGRAALEARQHFCRSAAVLDPTDLKTLAQFSLMGDPSIQPVATTPHGLTPTKSFARAFPSSIANTMDRVRRRARLLRDGLALLQTVGAAQLTRAPTPKLKVKRLLAETARESHMTNLSFASFGVDRPFPSGHTAFAGKAKSTPRGAIAIHMAVGSRGVRGAKHKQVVVLVATVEDGQVTQLRRLFSR